MDQNVYCLYDRVAVAMLGALVLNRSDAGVVRMFNDLLASDERMRNHADDYEIRKIGIITEQGELTPMIPVTIATGSQWRASQTVELAKEA